MSNYKRTIKELEEKAALWWPEVLKDKNALANVLPLLLETQDDFLRLLNLSKKSPYQIFDLISAADFSANLFLKHLVVLSDFGGEPIQRLGRAFEDIFPIDSSNENYYFEFIWGQKYSLHGSKYLAKFGSKLWLLFGPIKIPTSVTEIGCVDDELLGCPKLVFVFV